MSTTAEFRKDPFEVLKQRRDLLFASANLPQSAFLGTSSATPTGLVDSAKASLKPEARVLILGNGRSAALAALADTGFAVTLCDWSPLALAATEDVRRTLPRSQSARLHAALAKGAHLPFADAAFDGIIITGILNELEHTTPLVKECARLLANNGKLLLTLPDDLAFYHPEFARPWTAEAFNETLALFFDTVETTVKNGFLHTCASNRVHTRHPVIYAMMNIRNEDRWLREVLDNAARICDGIVVYDDSSTDKTPEICQVHPAVVAYQRCEETQTDKARDKNRMFAMAKEYPFDWMLCIDGDELLETTAPQRMLDQIRACSVNVSQIDFEFLYLWNDRRHYRTDGIYTGIFHPCLCRPVTQSWSDLTFEPTLHGGNLHCERTPQNLQGERIRADIKIEHLGYMFPEDRLRKYHWNKQKDPKHANEGYYEHLLDQPHMTLAAWDGRPATQRKGQTKVEKQTLKPDYYYANARRNLAERVPRTARDVLDVGCGNGATGALIAQLTGARVTGIEIHPEVANVARQVLTEVHVLDVEADALPFAPHAFDCILFGDVLEHLIDPWNTLKKLMRHLKPSGCVIASLPNVRNLGVIGKLLEGSWSYQEFGILDSTHLRFFARDDMVRLFAQAGLRAELVETVRDPLFEQQMQAQPREPVTVDLGGLVLRDVTPQDLNELTAQQFIFVATPDASVLPKQKPLASVVIPVFNNLRYTRSCLESIFNTPELTPLEVIVVNDGSTDGTRDYLLSLGERVTVLEHDRNYGFARSCNDGARAAAGQIVVFLNNDTEVLPGWLDAMIKIITEDRSIGIVGNLQIFPETGQVQQAGIVCDEQGQVHSIYNNQLPADHPVVNKPREFQFIAGSCLTIWRQLFMEVGGFDESYVNSCEDIDLCLKVTRTRRKVFYCPQSRIYHHESKSVTSHDKSGANYRLLLSRWKQDMRPDADEYYLNDGFMRLSDGRIIPLENEAPKAAVQNGVRLALLTTYHQRCGLAIYAEQMCSAVAAQGNVPLVLAEQTTERTASDEPNVLRCWTREANGGKDIVSHLLKHGSNVLHVNHGGIFALDGWLLDVLKQARAHGIRIVTTFHATETRDERLAEIARYSDSCWVHHPQNVVELVALGAPPQRIQVMPMPLDEIKATDVTEAKLALGWDPARKVITTFGMMDPHKGVLELIESMPELGAMVDAKLLIVGTSHPNSEVGANYVTQCRNRVDELNLVRNVEFITRFVADDELTDTLQASDVIVLNYQSRRFEGSACLTRALATGRPVVTSDAPALDIAAPVTARTTEQFNLSRAIYRALTNPFLTRSLLDSLTQYAGQVNWNATASRLLADYRQVFETEPACTTDLLKFYATHPDEIYTEALQRERVRWLASKAEGMILEIGPANGYVVDFCNGHEAVDIYRERIDVASALRPRVKFSYGNVVTGLPYPDKQFDTVMSPEIFEHVEWEQAIVALKECMRVGRRVLITIPNADKPDYNPDLVHNPEHRWLVTRQLVDGWLQGAGAIDYELDCSNDLDFYLIDINSAATTPNVRVTPRAQKLPHFEVTPGPNAQLAIEASLLTDERGLAGETGRYFLELLNNVREVRTEWQLLLVSPKPDLLKQKLSQAGVQSAYRVITWNELSSSEADALFLPNPTCDDTPEFIRIAKESGMTVVCSMNDLIPLAFPQYYLTSDPLARDRYVASLRALSESCDIFYCTTQATLTEMQIRMGMPLARLRVLHGGPTIPAADVNPRYESAELQTALGTGTPFFVHAGDLAAARNLRLIMLACQQIRRTTAPDMKLVLVCPLDSKSVEQIKSAMKRDGVDPALLIVAPNPNDADSVKLFSGATAYLSPSLQEGLSLEQVNALACGTPVIAGDTPSQRETCGDGALYVDPTDVGAVTTAMRMLLEDGQLRGSLREMARGERPRYDWRRSAEKLAVYLTEQLVKQGRRSMAARPVPTAKS
ncbi:MAG: glycosyltransferase [bacterium]|nr:glycosyltransferase [bacterium]